VFSLSLTSLSVEPKAGAGALAEKTSARAAGPDRRGPDRRRHAAACSTGGVGGAGLPDGQGAGARAPGRQEDGAQIADGALGALGALGAQGPADARSASQHLDVAAFARPATTGLCCSIVAGYSRSLRPLSW